jgi:hypothetical protein
MADSNERILEALRKENRRFAPPKEFVRKARVSSASVYCKADQPRLFGGLREGVDWFAVEKGPRLAPPGAKWFVGGKLKFLAWTGIWRARGAGRAHLGRRAG